MEFLRVMLGRATLLRSAHAGTRLLARSHDMRETGGPAMALALAVRGMSLGGSRPAQLKFSCPRRCGAGCGPTLGTRWAGGLRA